MKYEVQVHRKYGDSSLIDESIIYEEGWYKYDSYFNQMSAERVANRLRASGFIVRVKLEIEL